MTGASDGARERATGPVCASSARSGNFLPPSTRMCTRLFTATGYPDGPMHGRLRHRGSDDASRAPVQESLA
jgi:hypothetical protein